MREIVSFAAGVTAGAALATFIISEEDRKKFRKTIMKQIEQLRSEHEGPIMDGVGKVKKMMKAYTA